MISRKPKFRYEPLDLINGYEFSQTTAYGQANQALDLAASNPQYADKLVLVADRWLKIVDKIEESVNNPRPTIGFVVPARGEETEDDSTESNEQTDVQDQHR